MSADGGKPPPPRVGAFMPEEFCDEGEDMLDTGLQMPSVGIWCPCDGLYAISVGF